MKGSPLFPGNRTFESLIRMSESLIPSSESRP